jgi:hypothetical protein
MLFRYKRETWVAFGATCLFMAIWTFSPLGEFVSHLFADVNPEFALWAWPVCGLSFFWAIRLVLFVRARRHSEVASLQGAGKHNADGP